jgi:5-methylcytosine-specific restriction endonuclease McrA
VGLRRASAIELRTSGGWFLRRLTVHAPGATSEVIRLTGAQLARVERDHEHGPALLGEIAGRRLWWIGDDCYWDDERLEAEQVALEIWDRERRRDHRFGRLRQLRAQTEAASAARRERIPSDVRAFVWARDNGACVQCGSEQDLQFDHVIPVSRGGGNAAGNIQVLCGDCNRMKSDSVA